MNAVLVIPHYNRRDLLARVLDALAKQTVEHSVVVVDNGSTDGSAELAEVHGSRVLRLDKNYGFAYAVNRGVEAALTEGATHIGIVNNDVVPEPNWLSELLATDAPFACGKLLDEKDSSKIDGAFDLVSSTGLTFRGGHGQASQSSEFNRSRSILSAPMTAAIFRREVFETIGLLDESFGSYLEDAEFGLRCGLAGFYGQYVPTAVATHRGSATLGTWHTETVRLISRNQILLIAKHYPARWMWSYGCFALVGQVLWGLAAFRHGKGTAYLRGKREGIKLWHGMRGRNESSIRDVFRKHADELRVFAPNRFWKVIAWMS